MNEIERLKDVTKRVEAGLNAISQDLKEDKQREMKSAVFQEWSEHLNALKAKARSRQAELENERKILSDPQLALFETGYRRHGHTALQMLDTMSADQLLIVVEKYRDPIITSKALAAIKGMDGVDSGILYRMAAHAKSYIDSQQIRHCANQELEVLNALNAAEAVTGNGGDATKRMAYGRRVEELKKIIGD